MGTVMLDHFRPIWSWSRPAALPGGDLVPLVAGQLGLRFGERDVLAEPRHGRLVAGERGEGRDGQLVALGLRQLAFPVLRPGVVSELAGDDRLVIGERGGK